MLLVVFAGILVGCGAAVLAGLAGHPFEAIAFVPLFGSIGGLMAAVTIGLLGLNRVSDAPVSITVREAIGSKLQTMYADVLEERMPARLSMLAAQL